MKNEEEKKPWAYSSVESVSTLWAPSINLPGSSLVLEVKKCMSSMHFWGILICTSNTREYRTIDHQGALACSITKDACTSNL